MSIPTEKFLQLYGNLLVNTWAIPELKDRFKSSPVNVLKEFGLDPGSATVNVIVPHENPGPECTPESAAEMWNEGIIKGEITFVYPDNPPENEGRMELSVDQLGAVAGGLVVACCCCSPCCCCD